MQKGGFLPKKPWPSLIYHYYINGAKQLYLHIQMYVGGYTMQVHYLCLPYKFMCVLVAQSCLTRCNPMNCSPLGSSVPGILQARILEWIAIPSLEDLCNPGIEPRSPTLQADSLLSEPPGKPIQTSMKSGKKHNWKWTILQKWQMQQVFNWQLIDPNPSAGFLQLTVLK